ncbi:MAG: response regulator [bacterium]
MLGENKALFFKDQLSISTFEDFVPSILFVDDEQNVLRSIKRLFRTENNYQLYFAQSAKEALDILEKTIMHIIVTDFRMPEINGVNFLKKVRESYPHTIRMILSGFADIRSIVEAINEGEIYKFIPKPWDNEDFKLTITNAIERYYLFKKNHELTEIIRKQNRELRSLNEELEERVILRTQDLLAQNKVLSLSQQVIHYLPFPLMAFNNDGIVVMENNEAQRLMGKSLLNARDSDFLPCEIVKLMEEVKAGKKRQRESQVISFRESNAEAIVIRFSAMDPQNGVILVLLYDESRE